jgi:nicotinamide riboside kinase
MDDIVYGQYAAQLAVAQLPGKPFIFQDTDLLSTLGYYRIYGGKQNPQLASLISKTPSDLYIVMNSRIPFTADVLRYGGDRRESSDEFWIEILREHGRPFYYVRETEPYAQSAEIRTVLQRLFHQQTDWSWFKREAA